MTVWKKKYIFISSGESSRNNASFDKLRNHPYFNPLDLSMGLLSTQYSALSTPEL
jgi:hypothetical protein